MCFGLLGCVLKNAYVLYLKICDDYGIPKVIRVTHLEFRKGVALAWINTEVNAEEWKAKEAASRTNDTISVKIRKRFGNNKAISMMTMNSSFS